jgi:3D (Asp-Asp-Asp) domain-containing protein
MIYYPQTRFKSYLCNSYRDLAFKSINSQNKHAFVPQPNVITQPQLNNRDKFESSKEVEEKQKKKGLSTKAKWLIGIGVGITSIIASAALILRRKYVNLQKLYDEKLTPANLAEHIEFKEAETIEEEDSNLQYLGEFRLTGYDDCVECQEQWVGTTALGIPPRAQHTIAVDPDIIPLGSKVMINGQEYRAEDVGGGVKGNHIDVFVGSHQETFANYCNGYADVYLIVE